MLVPPLRVYIATVVYFNSLLFLNSQSHRYSQPLVLPEVSGCWIQLHTHCPFCPSLFPASPLTVHPGAFSFHLKSPSFKVLSLDLMGGPNPFLFYKVFISILKILKDMFFIYNSKMAMIFFPDTVIVNSLPWHPCCCSEVTFV